MNEHHRDALIAALQVPPDEGGYVKTVGKLVREADRDNDTDTFCCLGVACDIFGLWEWDGYEQGVGLTFPQMQALGMSPSEHALLANSNDSSDTFGPVIEALRGM